ncbi:MAG: hypothetical protein DBX55_06845 [Verrucomicrobia bacterium]|nr:MAG: hypothetical protein DBX55_06845 [Verrucomicrobiota bacterium]
MAFFARSLSAARVRQALARVKHCAVFCARVSHASFANARIMPDLPACGRMRRFKLCRARAEYFPLFRSGSWGYCRVVSVFLAAFFCRLCPSEGKGGRFQIFSFWGGIFLLAQLSAVGVLRRVFGKVFFLDFYGFLAAFQIRPSQAKRKNFFAHCMRKRARSPLIAQSVCAKYPCKVSVCAPRADGFLAYEVRLPKYTLHIAPHINIINVLK